MVTTAPRREGGMTRAIGRAAILALCVLAIPTARARADVALCGSFPTPRSDARALERAPFAFDGVAVAGRAAESNRRAGLVSPLTFRVTRWIKGDRSHEVALPSGDEGVRIWDGRYARLSDRILESYDQSVTTRIPGELVARPGQAWRIYATQENGVNFTCTNLLGSHPLQRSVSPPLSSPTHTGPSEPSRRSGGWGLGVVVALVTAGVVALLSWAALRRSRTRRARH
jgi:hypothetical protein